jgi:hypothetical protein
MRPLLSSLMISPTRELELISPYTYSSTTRLLGRRRLGAVCDDAGAGREIHNFCQPSWFMLPQVGIANAIIEYARSKTLSSSLICPKSDARAAQL